MFKILELIVCIYAFLAIKKKKVILDQLKKLSAIIRKKKKMDRS